jgi:general secretion pathway protein G
MRISTSTSKAVSEAGPRRARSLGTGFLGGILRDESRTFAGFTLLELMVVVAILGALSAVSIPMYLGYVKRARVAKAVADIYHLQKLIMVYQHDLGVLPDSLADIGAADMRDPWGNPYHYLKIREDEEETTTGKDKDKGKGPDKDQGAKEKEQKRRKNRFLVPINDDFDLYSSGPDGRSVAPLTATASRDDIVRAYEGSFVGRALECPP